VLDLACGPGRHAVPLAQRGLKVTGVDLSNHLLQQAGEYADRSACQVEWVREDMRSFKRQASFDLIICMWTSFGYFDDPDDDLMVLQNCHHNLADGGALLLDVVGKERVIRDLNPVHLTEFDNGDLLVERPLLSDEMTRYNNEWLLIRGDRVDRTEWHHQLYSGLELGDRLQQAGFSEVSIKGSLDGDEYDLDAERLIAVAWK